MPQDHRNSVAVLGLGAMGRMLAGTLLDAGHAVTVWNRTPGRDAELLERGARAAPTAAQAAAAAPVVIVCLFDHRSVRATLDPAAEALSGHALINVTTTTPREARDLAAWAARHDIDYLDGAIMATPPMIGGEHAAILYSGSRDAFDQHRPMLDVLASSTFESEDAGMASLLDLALLSGMYSLITGFLHGAAMVRSAGISATEFAHRATPFLTAMTGTFERSAETIDGGDYAQPVQSLTWTASALETIARASREQGVDPVPVTMVQRLVQRQIDDGHGDHDADRMYESLRAS